ncbi:copper resistance CopC family protein [Nocardia donostiensis]|uniref:copper resistance CopC family protein n=1 Tax=Nocardia donostiensis TaxID=1538463 RepID=UPI0009DA2DE2|nr:copper resistance CopC family protein [Nocardia donostiensis]
MVRRHIRGNRVSRLVLAIVSAVLYLTVGLVAAGQASAHSAVVGSDPEDGSTVQSSPQRVSVTFNENLQPSFPQMTVVGPDGNLWSKGEPVVEGKTVSVEVGELGPAGVYQVAFRVTSSDGHPVGGQRSFTLANPGNGVPGPPASPQAAEGEDAGGVPVLVIVVIAVVVLLAGGLLFMLFGTSRMRGRSEGKNDR